MLFALCASALAASPVDVAVVVSRQDGVSQTLSKAHLAATVQVLTAKGLTVTQPPIDALSCAGKRPCLVSLMRGQRIPVLVTVELAGVLDEVVVFVEALSLEEDGRRLLRVETKSEGGKVAPLADVLPPLADAIQTYLKPVEVAAAKPAPAPVTPPTPPAALVPAEPAPTTAAPAPAPPSVTEKATSPRALAWAPLLAAGTFGLTSGVFYGLMRSTEAEILMAGDRARVRQLVPHGETLQAISGVMLGLALANAAVGVVMLLLGAPAGS